MSHDFDAQLWEAERDGTAPSAADFYDHMALSRRLGCGHRVEASEESGGMDELDRVTLADVQDLLDFKVRVHQCENWRPE